jgi:hypothetical protein
VPTRKHDRIQASGNSVGQDVTLETLATRWLYERLLTKVAEGELGCPNVGRSLLKNDGVLSS